MKVLRKLFSFLSAFALAAVLLAEVVANLDDLFAMGPLFILAVVVAATATACWKTHLPDQRTDTSDQAIADHMMEKCPGHFERLKRGALIESAQRAPWSIVWMDLEHLLVQIEGNHPNLCAALAEATVAFQFSGLDGVSHAVGTAVRSSGSSLFISLEQVDMPPHATDIVRPIWTEAMSESDLVLIKLLARKER